jgi:hypothetical protein
VSCSVACSCPPRCLAAILRMIIRWQSDGTGCSSDPKEAATCEFVASCERYTSRINGALSLGEQFRPGVRLLRLTCRAAAGPAQPEMTQKRHRLFAPTGPPTAVSAGGPGPVRRSFTPNSLPCHPGPSAVRSGLPKDKSKTHSRPRCQRQSAIYGERQSRGHRCSPPAHKRNTRAFSWPAP